MTRVAPDPGSAARQASRSETVRRCPVARLRVHPQADLVPPMTGAEYRHFLAEVERSGILAPLEVTAAGVVLNGRHRLRAAQELALKTVPIREVEPADELEYMFVCALAQRHLSLSQRAAIVVELKQIREAADRGRLRQRANLRRGDKAAPEVARLPARGAHPRERRPKAGSAPARLSRRDHRQGADPALLRRVKLGEGQLSSRPPAGSARPPATAALPAAPPPPRGPFEV